MAQATVTGHNCFCKQLLAYTESWDAILVSTGSWILPQTNTGNTNHCWPETAPGMVTVFSASPDVQRWVPVFLRRKATVPSTVDEHGYPVAIVAILSDVRANQTGH